MNDDSPVCPKHNRPIPRGFCGVCGWSPNGKSENRKTTIIIVTVLAAWAVGGIAQAGDYMGDTSAPWVPIYYLSWVAVGVAAYFMKN